MAAVNKSPICTLVCVLEYKDEKVLWNYNHMTEN